MRFFSFAILPFSLAVLASAGPIVDKRASFALQNGKQAQALNAKFASLSAKSPCTSGEVACVQGAFAQCVNGKFVTTPCSGGLTCVALPLVNSPGTSVTCDTEQDAADRIARTGASGGLRGRDIEARAAFTLQNGQEAQALNRKFQSLNANSPCQEGENACVNGGFAQCVGGKFVVTPCNTGLTCMALPLVLSPGTSLVCDTQADALARIAATGASGGLFGRSEPELESRAVNAPAACKAKKREDITERSEEAALVRRIAQSDLPAVANSWAQLCRSSGGDINNGDPCDQLGPIGGINALLANADPCAQQDNADAMIDFAKSKGVKNKEALIKNAIAYRRHPRNALNINGVVPSTPFCQRAPRNPELKGVVNAQLDGVDPGLFGAPNIAIFPFGQSGSCPFGKKANTKTCTCE
ncbi:hypothetical protein BN946_scf185014.g6 [Trametes cinnabarina]|uniref:Carbohydrate-binding module family 19 domain-containing protein n=1 Tax=Pycnoporus cinnabarinus TaxID=5643 RepID=A0A060SH54_PYCCI|nr:hypothetical protein BN946_scf185014.g6 [Trametes cinnabarina]